MTIPGSEYVQGISVPLKWSIVGIALTFICWVSFYIEKKLFHTVHSDHFSLDLPYIPMLQMPNPFFPFLFRKQTDKPE